MPFHAPGSANLSSLGATRTIVPVHKVGVSVCYIPFEGRDTSCSDSRGEHTVLAMESPVISLLTARRQCYSSWDLTQAVEPWPWIFPERVKQPSLDDQSKNAQEALVVSR